MKPKTLGIALAAFLVAAGMAAAGELEGQWTLTIEGKTPPGKNFAFLHFAQKDGTLKVTMKGKGGEVKSEGTHEDGTLRWVHTAGKGVVATFTGQVAGDLMGGDVDMGDRGTSKWEAIRDGAADLIGVWTFQQKGVPMDYENLTKLHFSQDGPKLIATFRTGEIETVCEGTLDGDKVGFGYERDTHDGRHVSATYSGRIAGDLINGEVDMGEGGTSTWRATRDQ